MIRSAASPAVPTAFAFTLSSALAWAGHDCAGGCPPAVADLPADVWFVRRPGARSTARPQTLVVVEVDENPDAPPERIREFLHAVDQCTRPDGIRVRERLRDSLLAQTGPLTVGRRPSP
jgi:hypothetical protein